MSRDQAAVLAIDGGNSKTDVALVAADGTLLASGRGPGVRTFPTPEVLASIGAVIGAAALDAGLPGGWPVAAHTVACMANADLAEEEPEFIFVEEAEGDAEAEAEPEDDEPAEPRTTVELVHTGPGRAVPSAARRRLRGKAALQTHAGVRLTRRPRR